MVRVVLFLGAWLGAADGAAALNVCPAYLAVHQKEVDPRIRSGIPFKLLGVAVSEGGVWRRIVRVEYDLWDESVTVETLGAGTEVVKLAAAGASICKALSVPDAPGGHRYQYTTLLNPVLGNGLAHQVESAQQGRGGLLQIDWTRLAKDLETEKILLQAELGP